MSKDRFGFGTNVLDKVREVRANQEAIAPEIEEPLAPSRKWWDSYNNYTKYKDEPHWSDRAPVLQRNNPEYSGQFEESTYWNSPKLWGDPPAEERYWSNPQGYQEGGEIKIKPSKVGSFTTW